MMWRPTTCLKLDPWGNLLQKWEKVTEFMGTDSAKPQTQVVGTDWRRVTDYCPCEQCKADK